MRLLGITTTLALLALAACGPESAVDHRGWCYADGELTYHGKALPNSVEVAGTVLVTPAGTFERVAQPQRWQLLGHEIALRAAVTARPATVLRSDDRERGFYPTKLDGQPRGWWSTCRRGTPEHWICASRTEDDGSRQAFWASPFRLALLPWYERRQR